VGRSRRAGRNTPYSRAAAGRVVLPAGPEAAWEGEHKGVPRLMQRMRQLGRGQLMSELPGDQKKDEIDR
jgi:hypothetical protein